MKDIERGLRVEFIIIGQQPWDTEIGSNCKNIAIELSKEHRVLYVNSPLDRITSFRKKKDPGTIRRMDVINDKENGLIQITDNLWNYYPDCMVESISWINSHFIFDLVNRYNNYKFARSIKKALKMLEFNNFILFNDNEIFKGFYLKKFLNPKLSIYYSRDYMIAVDYWKKHGEKFEPKLIANNDLCVANSTFLAEYCRQFNPHSYYVGQGCDLDLFIKSTYKPLSDLLKTNRTPVIGYVGALQSIRLDMEIIAHIANSHPEWSVVLVGSEDEQFKASNLHHISNIEFTGNKQMNELADYINYFDVCINPQLVNEVTIGNYPRKIDEYLAVGKPVIATATKAMEAFSDFVYLADTKEQYVSLIEKALAENSVQLQDGRRAFAMEHTWENSVDAIYSAIELVSPESGLH